MTLTPRETEILALVAEGMSREAIAARIGNSPHTVKTQIESIRRKLKASTQAHAVAVGIRNGLIA